MIFPTNIDTYEQYVLAEGRILRNVRGDFNEEMYIRGAIAGLDASDETAAVALKAKWKVNLLEGRSPLDNGKGSLPMISQVEWHWCTEDIELTTGKRYLFFLTGEEIHGPRMGVYEGRTEKGMLVYHWYEMSTARMFANLWAHLPGPPPVKVDEYYARM